MAGMAAVSVVQGMGAARKQNIVNTNNATVAEQDAAARWTENAGANKTIAETNLQNQIRTGYRVGILNVQRGQAAKAAAQSGINLGKSKLQALGAANSNAAATGSIGSSVDAVVLDIEMQAEQADASLVEDQRIRESNFDTSMSDIIKAGEDALQSPQNISVRKVAAPGHIGMGEVLGNALVSTAGQYAQQNMSLGLGKAKVKPPTVANVLF
jgi:hypothetical protein